MMLGPAQSASAQYPRFRVTDLKDLGSVTDVTLTVEKAGTIGINNKGQVVYTYEASSGLYHAWVWLPVSEYGFSANTVHDLDTSGNSSVARDINENGKIAGCTGGLLTNREATVWTLSSGSASATTIGSTPSDAHALNNDSSPDVVGWRIIDEECGFFPETTDRECAFSWEEGGSVTNLDAIGTYADEFSTAYDIRRNGSRIVVGLSESCGRLGICSGQFEGTVWQPGSSANILDMGDIRDDAIARDPRPYGVNDDGNIVGWVWFDPDDLQTACFPTAAFWENASDDEPVDLAEFLANEFDISRAFAINSLADPQVVGHNLDTDYAILWEYDSTNGWSSVDLDDSANGIIPACSDSTWEISEAHDINDNGWIVAFGENSSNEKHALLLTPVPDCPVDTNQDGCIDRIDYNTVLDNWGDCPAGSICYADVDLNCTVNIDDLVSGVLYYWCECPCDSPCSDGFQSSGSGSLPIEELIVDTLESGIPSADQAAIIAYLSSL